MSVKRQASTHTSFPVKRWFLEVVSCLLAGALITCSVAFGGALWGPPPVLIRDGASVSLMHTKSPAGSPGDYTYQWGWPMRSFAKAGVNSTLQFLRTAREGSPRREWYWRLRPASSFDGNLPRSIIPVGFTLNTLLAAGVLMGVVETIAWARRRGGRRRGRCPACGYDRRGLAGGDAAACPECGAGV